MPIKNHYKKITKFTVSLLFLVSFNLISVGVTFSPQLPLDIRKIAFEGTASWYSCNDPGVLKTTANREVFNDKKLTCAIWDIPFNALLKVTNLNNGKSVIVRVNDRGPAKRLVKKGRIIDLTKEAFCRIANLDRGLINVSVEILYLPLLNHND